MCGRNHGTYMPGFLAFRELPLILDAAQKLESHPDLYFFDGNGYLHQRHMGIATHAALCLGKPSIGVAKNLLLFKEVKYFPPENIKGAFSDVLYNNEICGRALRTRKDVKPVFVSCGNWVALDTAIKMVMNLVTGESRLPIPTRLADLHSREMRKS